MSHWVAILAYLVALDVLVRLLQHLTALVDRRFLEESERLEREREERARRCAACPAGCPPAPAPSRRRFTVLPGGRA